MVVEIEELELVIGFLYSSILFPAPQYCNGFPGQMKLQSPISAKVDASLRVFPQ